MDTLTFYPAKGGYTRAHISADNFENELGLSCDHEHVVGFLNASPIMLALSGTFEGAGDNLTGILPDGTRFAAWKVTKHDKEPRAARRISRKAVLGWLPESAEVPVVIQPLEGEAAVLTLLGTTSKWVPKPLQQFLNFDDPLMLDEDDEIEDEQEPEEEPLETYALITHAKSRSEKGDRLQVKFPRADLIFKHLGIPVWLPSGERNRIAIRMWYDQGMLRICLAANAGRKVGKAIQVKQDDWTVGEYFTELGLDYLSQDTREQHKVRVFNDRGGHWLIEIDLAASLTFIPAKETTDAEG